MKSVTVSKNLRPNQCGDLIRLGKDFDGGYLVCKRDVEASDGLIGLGVCDDWSFEGDFRAINKVTIEAYDRSVGGRFFFNAIFRRFLRLYNLPKFLKAITTFFSYFYFFGQSGVTHHRKYIGANFPPKMITLKEAFQNMAGEKTFLKIDIEGSEYRILDDLIEGANRTSGLAIEFHDCDLHMDRILKFVDDYPLSLVHFHINTGSIVSSDGIPYVIELTFSSSEKGNGEFASLPHALDMPNAKGASEINIDFAS